MCFTMRIEHALEPDGQMQQRANLGLGSSTGAIFFSFATCGAPDLLLPSISLISACFCVAILNFAQNILAQHNCLALILQPAITCALQKCSSSLLHAAACPCARRSYRDAFDKYRSHVRVMNIIASRGVTTVAIAVLIVFLTLVCASFNFIADQLWKPQHHEEGLSL